MTSDPAASTIAATPRAATRDVAIRAVVDLTLGAWRPREAARQLALALGVALGPGLPPDRETSPITNERRGLDAAAEGDPVARLCFDDARRIAAVLPPTGTVIVLAPRFGRGIGSLNEWFFHFLRRGAVHILLNGPAPPTTMVRAAFERAEAGAAPPPGLPIDTFNAEQQRLLRFFPGLLPRAIADAVRLVPAATALVPVGEVHFLIPPAYRDTDPFAAPQALDAMEALEALDEGFRALAQSGCTAHFADSATLAAAAERAFHAGEGELARELATRARAVARDPETAARADAVRHEVRLHQHRFAEVIATPEPSPRASEGIRLRLAALRLRAAVERGERDAVPDGLAAATARLERNAADGDDLHLLNLHVAARIRRGDPAGAGALAERLERAAETAGEDRLLVAALANRAALCRRTGDRDGERRVLSRLFGTTAGSRSLAEIVAMNVAQARAAPDQAAPAARDAWLRAAFAWLAFEPFEAFPAAAVEAVLGTASVPRPQLDQAVSEAIGEGLAASGGAPAAVGDELLPSIRFHAGAAMAAERVIGGPGLALLWARPIDWAPPSPFRQALLASAWTDFRARFPAGEVREGTIFVDDDLGTDLPATREAALGAALRHGIGEVRFGEERIAIDATTRPRFAADMRIGLSGAVAGIADEGGAIRVRFRRIYPDATIEGPAREAVAALRDGGRMPLGALAVLLGLPLAETEQLLRGLEAGRILRVDVARRAAPEARACPDQVGS